MNEDKDKDFVCLYSKGKDDKIVRVYGRYFFGKYEFPQNKERSEFLELFCHFTNRMLDDEYRNDVINPLNLRVPFLPAGHEMIPNIGELYLNHKEK